MRKLVASAVLAFAAWVVPIGTAAPANVNITSTGFSPSTVSIEVGESVTWRNNDQSAHRVVVSGTSCNLSLQPNQSSSCTFNSPGTLSYSDPGEGASGFRGTINVTRAPARAVTIDADRNAVIFGGAINLHGAVSSGDSGENVTITVDPLNAPERRIALTTGQGGEWELRVQPRIETTYTAVWRNQQSRAFTALVRPRISLRKVGRNLFSVVVVAARSFDGSRVIVKRQRSRRSNRLVTAARVFLNENPRTRTISQARFRLRVPRGYKLRAFLPAAEAGEDYLPGQSNFIRV